MNTTEPYNPLDKRNLAKNVAEMLLNRTVEPMPPQPFEGAGIYAIYYIRPLAKVKLS